MGTPHKVHPMYPMTISTRMCIAASLIAATLVSSLLGLREMLPSPPPLLKVADASARPCMGAVYSALGPCRGVLVVSNCCCAKP